MKYILYIVAFLAIISWTRAHEDFVYDWAQHKDGEELYTSLKDETQDIFVLYWYKPVEGNDALKKKNEELRDKIKKDVLSNHPDIVYSEINMAEDGKEDKYKKLIQEIMQLKLDELEKGPIISVVNNGEGAWIHGDGTLKEVTESIDIFIHEANDRKKGGTGYVYGSDKARKDGSISVGGGSSY